MTNRWADFDLGEFLGIGLDTAQIAHLAGALFLGLFGVSAVRRAKGAGGVLLAVWLAVGIGLFAGALLVVARGFPNELPPELIPWTDPDRLSRAGAVLIVLACALVFLSAHWVRGGLARFFHRLAGLALAGTAVGLAAGWFAAELPDEARPWTTQTVLVRIVVVAGLVFLAVAFWGRQTWAAPHVRWANRILTPPALAMAVILTWHWFGGLLPEEISGLPVGRVAAILAAVASGTCLAIATGSYLLRERPVQKPPRRAPVPQKPIVPAGPPRPLPVALLLDNDGRPVLPPTPIHPGQPGPLKS